MFPGNKLSIFTRQRHFTIKGDGDAIFRQAREVRHQHMIGRGQHDHVVAAIVLIDTDNIEQVHGEGDQVGIVILLFNAFCQCLGFFRHRWSGFPAGDHAPVPVVLSALHVARGSF